MTTVLVPLETNDTLDGNDDCTITITRYNCPGCEDFIETEHHGTPITPCDHYVSDDGEIVTLEITPTYQFTKVDPTEPGRYVMRRDDSFWLCLVVIEQQQDDRNFGKLVAKFDDGFIDTIDYLPGAEWLGPIK